MCLTLRFVFQCNFTLFSFSIEEDWREIQSILQMWILVPYDFWMVPFSSHSQSKIDLETKNCNQRKTKRERERALSIVPNVTFNFQFTNILTSKVQHVVSNVPLTQCSTLTFSTRLIRENDLQRVNNVLCVWTMFCKCVRIKHFPLYRKSALERERESWKKWKEMRVSKMNGALFKFFEENLQYPINNCGGVLYSKIILLFCYLNTHHCCCCCFCQRRQARKKKKK